MENLYAQALWQVVTKSQGKAAHADPVHTLHAKLKSEGRAALMPRIARAFERIALREAARTTIVLTIADSVDAVEAEKSARATLSSINLSDVHFETRVDPSLIGGWRLEGHEQLVDASYKKHLLALYQNVTHA
jgi:F-type H+-transporting ATPase subunit delta